MSNRRPHQGVLLLFATVALFLAQCATGRSPVGEPNVNFDVYRGVGAKDNGNASLSPAAFKFNGGDMSTFNATSADSKCYFQFTITNLPQLPPVRGDQGNLVGNLNFTAIFDDNPPGHWNIQQPGTISATTAASRISVYAQQNRGGRVHNGSQDNCY
jgi:hypothetical protein